MRVVKWLGVILLGVAIAIGVLVLVAPYRDGPTVFIPGGPLEAGELVTAHVTNWSFAESLDTIEMQLITDDNRSRTTWILVHKGAAFIPVALGFPPNKRWHHLAVKDGRAIVRLGGKRYPVNLKKVTGTRLRFSLAHVSAAKYPPAPGADGGSWYFELIHRVP